MNFFLCASPARICFSRAVASTCSKCPSIFNCQRSLTPRCQVLGFRCQQTKLTPDTWNLKPSFLVGLGRVELPTSPLSGVRSSHLSYRPDGGESGGAGRDRTGDLLNANQALSQLSYSPRKSFEADWTQGSRRPASRPLTKTSDTPRRDPERDTTTL